MLILKKIIKDILIDAINRAYPNSDFFELIEVQNVTAKNVEAGNVQINGVIVKKSSKEIKIEKKTYFNFNKNS